MHMKFSKKQLEKMADQIRLLSWGQGAILTSSLHVNLNWFTMLLIFVLWMSLQGAALYFDRRSES
jgi:hypothetical protein